MYLNVHVTFNQGLVKTFLVPQETLMMDFVAAVRAFGKFRSMRFYPDVDQAAASLLAATGNATIMELRREKA